MLANAIKDIEIYHPFRHEIARVTKEALDIKKRVEAGESARTDKYSQNPNFELSMTTAALNQRANKSVKHLIKHNIPSFKISSVGEQLGLIQASCLIVTEAFSGVRVGLGVTGDASIPAGMLQSRTPIMIEGATHTGGNGAQLRNVLFMDGHVEAVALSDWSERIQPYLDAR